MQDPLGEIEERLIAELHSLALDARGLHAVLQEYDRLEAETAERLREQGAEGVVISVQRTLAAAKLSTAVDKNADTETAVELFKRSEEHGYETPEKRLVAIAIFARICLANGRADLAILELEDALQKARMPASLHTGFETLLKELYVSRR